MNFLASSLPLAAGGGETFEAPGPGIFDLPPVFEVAGVGVTKPMLQLVLGAIVVFGLFYAAVRRPSLVPGRLQYVGEGAYGFVRNGVARDIIGGRDFQKFVPYLVAVFFFILINNVFASIPFIQFPTFGRASMAYALAGMSWLVYNAVGIHKHGLLGYLKLQCVPSGVSPFMYPLLVPLEFFSNILVRPVTLALRLFCNMFAGHILLVLFATGGQYMLLEGSTLVQAGRHPRLGPGHPVSFLELLVQFLQAYVFTLLNAMYISGALADEH